MASWKPPLHFECPPPPPPPKTSRRGRKVSTPPVLQVKILNPHHDLTNNDWVSPQFQAVEDKKVIRNKKAKAALQPRSLFHPHPTNEEDSCHSNNVPTKQRPILEFVVSKPGPPETTTPRETNETTFTPLSTSTPTSRHESTILAEDTPTHLYGIHPYHQSLSANESSSKY